MANSDDEIEDLPEWVTNYYFEDDTEGPISFSVLPFCWNAAETTTNTQKKIYVRGNANDGLEKIFKPVKAWRFDISGAKPEISVLCKDNNWIKLQKPRTSFEEYVRTILVTVNFLHLAKKNPEMPGKRIWKKLSNIFSLYDVIPSARDLLHHKELIEQVMKHDESLKESKHLVTLLQRYPQKMQKADEDVLNKGKSDFVVDDDNCSLDDLEDDSSDDDDGSGGEHAGSADEEDGEEESFDSVCSICDEGGPLLCCEGSCMRSFHATLRAGKPSQCSSLGFTEKEVQAMPYFKCENCQLKQHQCFGCGRLDSSDKQAGAKVFQCVNATCGYFYHPLCVAKRLCVKDATTAAAAEELANKILSGESFTCPLHICFKCKQGEDKSNAEMQMAVCRRCPKAYHKKCLPKDIAFEEDEDANINQRAWEGLLVDRILIYCLKHEILDDLGTPARDHIIFPSKFKKDNAAPTVAPKKLMPSLRAPSQAVPTSESRKKAINDSDPDKKIAIKVPKLQRSNTSKKLAPEKKSGLVKTDERKYSRQLSVVSPINIEKPEEVVSIQTSKIGVKTPEPQLDSDSERRILDLINEASSIITLDDIIAKHEKLISSRSYQQKTDSCKSITMGKVEASCEAVRAASKKLAAGYEEDANSICGRKVVIQMANWKGKLRVYLAPFLHGMRYTSFGRHFTKVEKLKEVSDTLHWYANEGDTIVDFCCGANDFSCLMKQNLESRGIKCNYKNYDLFPPKNDFCFETRDWLTVKPSELPNGSKLIMGINPPFGVKSYLANKFINKALQFKPKLIVLIVPPETERLDKKKPAYDLIWEYDDKLSGKSFYLPGSVDINDNQMEDWNLVTPVLYLWSRPDWTSKHMEIAEKHQHLPGERRENKLTMKLGRDSSFKIENQSITNVDNNPPNAHLPVIDKAVSEGNDVDKRSARADRSMDKNVHVVSGDSRPKKGPKKKRQRVMRNIRREPESSHKYKRQRSSLDRPRDEVMLRSPSDMEIDQFQPTRYDERRSSQSHTPRYQGSSQNELRAVGHVSHGHFDSGHYGERERERERLSLLDNRPFRHQESPSNVDIRDHLNNHPRASYGTGNYGNAYHDTYQNIRDTSYPPPQRHPDSTIDYMNQSFGGSVESYPTSVFNRAATNSVSAIDKYNFSLDAPNHGRMAGGGFSRPDIGPPVGASLYHPQAPPRQGYPYDQRDFSQGPTHSHSYHIPPGGWIDD